MLTFHATRTVRISSHWFKAPQIAARRFSTAAIQYHDYASDPWTRLLSAKDLERHDIEHAIAVATQIGLESRTAGPWRQLGPGRTLNILEGKMLANLFFEPSTRTASSFATAMVRMGGSFLSLASETSSSKKGETLLDTMRVMAEYADCLVIRHPRQANAHQSRGAAARASGCYSPRCSRCHNLCSFPLASGSVFNNELADLDHSIPLLNAGNGANEHPTQALLDLLCIQTELGATSLDGLTVTLVGDLKNGRTVHSLATLLSRFEGVTLNLVAPAALRMPPEWVAQIRTTDAAGSAGVRVHELEDYKSVVGSSDVLYMTRVQRERFESQVSFGTSSGWGGRSAPSCTN